MVSRPHSCLVYITSPNSLQNFKTTHCKLLAVFGAVLLDQDVYQHTLITPFGSFGSSHWTTTVLELTGLARTLCGALPGAFIHAENTLTLNQQTFHMAIFLQLYLSYSMHSLSSAKNK